MSDVASAFSDLFASLDVDDQPQTVEKISPPASGSSAKKVGKTGGSAYPRPPPRKKPQGNKLTLPKKGNSRSKAVGRVSGKPLRLNSEESELASLKKISADLEAALTSGGTVASDRRENRRRYDTAANRGTDRYAYLDISDVGDFHERLPDPVLKFPFELDPFQKRAILHIERHESVFVAAHTSAGKTVVAEYAIQLAASAGAKVIYTSPIKTLSNQKYRDFSGSFPDVGLVTGDVSINPDAQCTIMTTEILRSMLYRSSDVIQDVTFVVFDEVQFLNDEERGVVWEESIIMLPPHIAIIMLSATVPNALEFASWVGRTKDRSVAVVTTSKRPVPLEHSLLHRYIPGSTALKETVILKQGGRFLSPEYREAMLEHENASGVNKLHGNDRQSGRGRGRGGGSGTGRDGGRGGADRGRGGARGGRGGRGGGRGGGGGRSKDVKEKGGGKWGANNAPARVAAEAMAGPSENTNKGESEWKPVVEHLRDNDLTPCVMFCFSKKKCEVAVESLSSMDLLPAAADKARVHSFFENAMKRLGEADRQIPQVLQVRENLKRGVASHHAGLLPIIKEVTEMLFSEGFVRVLFATETFAMGVNMPARTVCFTGVRKNDGRRFRNLEPGEYTQMAGRAGRRGIDKIGNVFLYFSSGERQLTEYQLKEVLTGEPITLKSAFRLTYNMILNILRVDELRVEEMMKKSFSEAAGEKKIDSVNVTLERVRKALGKSKNIVEEIRTDARLEVGTRDPCAPYSLADYARTIVQILRFKPADESNRQGKSNKILCTGRLVVTSNEDGLLSLGVIFASSVNSQNNRNRGLRGGTVQKNLCLALIVGRSAKAESVAKSLCFVNQFEDMSVGRGASSQNWRKPQAARSVQVISTGGLRVKLVIVDSKEVVYISELQDSISKAREKKQTEAVRQWLIDGSTRDVEAVMGDALKYLDATVANWAAKARVHPGTGFPHPYKSRLLFSVGGGAAPAIGDVVPAASPAFNAEGLRDSEENGEMNGDIGIGEDSLEKQVERIVKLCSSEEVADLLESVPAEERSEKIGEAVQREKIRVQVLQLQEYASTGNIPTLLPEYHKRVLLLQKLQYVGEDGLSVQLKGRCACEVATVDSVVLTEIVLENVLEGLDSCEVASLLSALICRKKNSDDGASNEEMKGVYSAAYLVGKAKMRTVVQRVGEAQEACGVGLDFDVGDDAKDYEDAICRWELCEVVLKWAQGATFASLASLTTVQAGDIVVCIKRLSELLRDTQSVAKAVGNNELWDVLEGSITAIQRDIIFSGSLYLE